MCPCVRLVDSSRLRPSPEQHPHGDGLSERCVRGDGAADLVSEGCPLARRRQPLGRQRGVDAADEVIKVEFVGVVEAGFGHV